MVYDSIGGSAGGSARAAKMTSERRSEIARKAAVTRWRNRTLADAHAAVVSKIDAMTELSAVLFLLASPRILPNPIWVRALRSMECVLEKGGEA